MSTCTCGNIPSQCTCQAEQPFCDQCSEDNSCAQVMDTDCVVYHSTPDTRPSKLDNLGKPNNTSVSEILEAIDDFLGNNANTPVVPVDTPSVNLTATGVAGHTIKADVKISGDTNNQLEERVDGLFAKPYNENYLVKVNKTDSPDYLENQIVGGTDGVVSVAVEENSGLLQVQPSIDILCLLKRIKEEFPEAFCKLIDDVCMKLGWTKDAVICLTEDLDIIQQKTGTGLPAPLYAFVDNGTVYFGSINTANAGVGKVWTINPETYDTTPTITYINETRTGTPYGVSGGTYYAGQPYRANSDSAFSNPADARYFYDTDTRTLFVHGNKTRGMDFYDFAAATWGKVTLAAGVTSNYLTTATTDAYTHSDIASNDHTNLMLTAWGLGAGSRGTIVIIVDKTTRQVTLERDTVASPVTGFSSNPFNSAWTGFITPTGDVIIGKGQSSYRNIAIMDSTLTFKQQLVLPVSNTGFAGQASVYWQSTFYDSAKDKIYVNDYIGKVIMVYNKVAGSYALEKTFTLANDSDFPTCQVGMAINKQTNELFFDCYYGDNGSAYTPDGTADALPSKMISYKIDRDTLEIKKVYIGQVKGTNLTVLPSGKFLTFQLGGNTPTAPESTGSYFLYTSNPDTLKTGVVRVTTLKQINVNNGTATGVTKPNTVGDPDYIADYVDNTACPITYTTAAPVGAVLTAKTTKITLEFGLDADVVKNPAIAKIRVTFKNGGTQVGLVEWTLPNTPNENAFIYSAAPTTAISVGNTIVANLEYVDSSNIVLDVHNSIATYQVLS